MSNETYDVVIPVLIRLNQAFPVMGLFLRRNVGGGTVRSGHYVKFGHAGQSDIGGICYGYAIEVECKPAASVKLRESQENWRAAVERTGGCFIKTHDPEEAVAGVLTYLASRGIRPNTAAAV